MKLSFESSDMRDVIRGIPCVESTFEVNITRILQLLFINFYIVNLRYFTFQEYSVFHECSLVDLNIVVVLEAG